MVGELPPDFLRVFPTTSNDGGVGLQVQQQQPFGMQTFNFVPMNTRGRLSVTIVEAKLAKNYGLVRMDPYVRLRIGDTVFETPTNMSGGKAPKWNRIVHAYLPHGVESMYLDLYDEVR